MKRKNEYSMQDARNVTTHQKHCVRISHCCLLSFLFFFISAVLEWCLCISPASNPWVHQTDTSEILLSEGRISRRRTPVPTNADLNIS